VTVARAGPGTLGLKSLIELAELLAGEGRTVVVAVPRGDQENLGPVGGVVPLGNVGVKI
jgi:hypothetical protein